MSLFGIDQETYESLKNKYEEAKAANKENYQAALSFKKKSEELEYELEKRKKEQFLHTKQTAELQEKLALHKQEIVTLKAVNETLITQNQEMREGETPLKEKITELESALEQARTKETELESHLNNLTKTLEIANSMLSNKFTWIPVGESDTELGYRGYDENKQVVDVIRVKKAHLKEIPISVTDGFEVFEDGNKYLLSLMDFIRTGKQPRQQPKMSIDIAVPSQLSSEEPTNERSLAPTQQRVVDYLKENPYFRNYEIARDLDIDRSQLTKILKGLIEKGIVQEADEGYCVVDNERGG